MLLPLFNFTLAFIPCVAIYFYFEKKKQLEKEYQDRIKALETKASTDPDTIEQVFSDFRTKGFSIVRIDSNDIFYRSPRG